MLPLWEVSKGEAGTIRVHVLSLTADLAQKEIKLGTYSEGPSKVFKEFQGLTIAFGFIWQ